MAAEGELAGLVRVVFAEVFFGAFGAAVVEVFFAGFVDLGLVGFFVLMAAIG
jgi:hypothetical protein